MSCSFCEHDGERVPVNRSALEYQAVLDKLLVVVFGTIGRFPARVVGANGSTVYVCTSSRSELSAGK